MTKVWSGWHKGYDVGLRIPGNIWVNLNTSLSFFKDLLMWKSYVLTFNSLLSSGSWSYKSLWANTNTETNTRLIRGDSLNSSSSVFCFHLPPSETPTELKISIAAIFPELNLHSKQIVLSSVKMFDNAISCFTKLMGWGRLINNIHLASRVFPLELAGRRLCVYSGCGGDLAALLSR